jgi:hypothetical protein
MAISKITGSALDKDVIMKDVATADGSSPTLTLQTGDTDIAADDVLGSINFQAPDEGAGTDAILVAAGIAAVSEGDFSSSNNATKLSFRTGASETATEKMSLSSGGTLTIISDATGTLLNLVSTEAGANNAPRFDITRNSASPAAGDNLGQIRFMGEDAADNSLSYVSMYAVLLDPTDSGEDGSFELDVRLAGSNRSRIISNATETIFNDDSMDLDFRVESNGNANMLFVDGGNDAVIIGHNDGISISGEQNELQVYDTNFSVASFATFRNGSDGATLSLAHSRSGTIGTQTVLNDGDIMGAFNFIGSDGTDMATVGAAIRGSVDGTPGSNDMPGRLVFLTTADGAAAASERMRISSDGTKNFGNSHTSGSGGFNIFAGAANTGSFAARFDGVGTGASNVLQFTNGNGQVGSITVNGSATAYTTSSDYRLKENVDYDWDATTRLKQLKPARFNFISDDTNTLVDGFIAHEASTVVPEAVSGTHNETITLTNVVLSSANVVMEQSVTQSTWTARKLDTTDINGDTVSAIYPSDSKWAAEHVVPVMQGIDQAKLVPLLVKTIQELEARITALEDE